MSSRHTVTHYTYSVCLKKAFFWGALDGQTSQWLNEQKFARAVRDLKLIGKHAQEMIRAVIGWMLVH